jgi:hypothetical protein
MTFMSRFIKTCPEFLKIRERTYDPSLTWHPFSHTARKTYKNKHFEHLSWGVFYLHNRILSAGLWRHYSEEVLMARVLFKHPQWHRGLMACWGRRVYRQNFHYKSKVHINVKRCSMPSCLFMRTILSSKPTLNVYLLKLMQKNVYITVNYQYLWDKP